MSKRKKKVYEDDDGRVIADMSLVDTGRGVPRDPASSQSQAGHGTSGTPHIIYTPSEKRAIMGGVLRAALLVGGVFALGFTLFLLFCIFIWF